MLVSCTIDDDGYDDCFQTSYIDGFTFLAAGIPALYAERRMTMRNCVVTVAQTGDFVSAVQLQGDGDDGCGGDHNLINNIIRTDGDTGVLVPAGCDIRVSFNTIVAGNKAIYLEGGDEESSVTIVSNILGGPGSPAAGVYNEHSGECYYKGNLMYGFSGVFDGNVTDHGSNDSYEAVDLSGDLFAGGLDEDLSDGDDTDYHLVDEGGTTYAVDLAVWNDWDNYPEFDFEGDPRPYGGGSDRGADEKVP